MYVPANCLTTQICQSSNDSDLYLGDPSLNFAHDTDYLPNPSCFSSFHPGKFQVLVYHNFLRPLKFIIHDHPSLDATQSSY